MRARSSCYVLPLAAATVIAWHAGGCLVDSSCVSDVDCPGNEICLLDGTCGLECTEDFTERCWGDRPECDLDENRCVECLDAEGCTVSEECVNHVCAPGTAPDFALTDLNSSSPTFGQVVSLSDFQGEVVFIFFAGLG